MARVSRRKQIAAAQGLPVDELPKAAALRIFRTALYVRHNLSQTVTIQNSIRKTASTRLS